jgi:hypothetical protein
MLADGFREFEGGSVGALMNYWQSRRRGTACVQDQRLVAALGYEGQHDKQI